MDTANQDLKIISERVYHKFNSLLQLAMELQLSSTGSFVVTNCTETTELNNEILGQCGLKYISSSRYAFDGGILLSLILTGELGGALIRVLGHNDLTAVIYNLESTDGDEDLLEYVIADHSDLKRIHLSWELRENDSSTLLSIESIFDENKRRNKLDSLETFVALKRSP